MDPGRRQRRPFLPSQRQSDLLNRTNHKIIPQITKALYCYPPVAELLMSPDNAPPDRPRALRPEGEGKGKAVVPPPAGRLSDSEQQGDHVLSAEGLPNGSRSCKSGYGKSGLLPRA
jgi:hypothetical protein